MVYLVQVRQFLLVCIAILITTACSGGPPSAALASPTIHASQSGAAVIDGGCGSTPVLKGGALSWMQYLDIPYVLGTPPLVGGIIFGFPLRAGHPTNPANKILWEVGASPYGPSLDITAHPVGQPTASVSQSIGFLSSGELPSIVDVPSPGCWHFDLVWSGHHAVVELVYR